MCYFFVDPGSRDHIDPSTKTFAVGAGLSRAWDVLAEEALKCQLLCRPCHVDKGAEDRPEPAHGYYRYWYYSCRCEVCRAANARKSARLREQSLQSAAKNSDFTVTPRSTSASKSAKP